MLDVEAPETMSLHSLEINCKLHGKIYLKIAFFEIIVFAENPEEKCIFKI